MNGSFGKALGLFVGIVMVGATLGIFAQAGRAGAGAGAGSTPPPSGPSVTITANGMNELTLVPSSVDGDANTTVKWEGSNVTRCTLNNRTVNVSDTRQVQVVGSTTFAIRCYTADGKTVVSAVARVRFVPTIVIGNAPIPDLGDAGLDKCPVIRGVRPGSETWERIEAALGVRAVNLDADTNTYAWDGRGFKLDATSAGSRVYKLGDHLCYSADGNRIAAR